MAAFARRERINYTTFVGWMHRAGSVPTSVPIRFAQVKMPATAAHERSGDYLWVISRPGSDVVFSFREARCQDELPSLLGSFRGVLQSDQYGVYASHERKTAGIVRVSCWAHARRNFHEAIEERPRPRIFIGHPVAGQRSAIIYSLVVSCERHGKDPLAYLRDFLTRLPTRTTWRR